MAPPPSSAGAPRLSRRRRLLAFAGALLALSAALWLHLGRAERDSSAAFVATDLREGRAVQEIPKGHPADDGFRWPTFGGNPQRTHALAVTRQLRPPYRTVWVRRGGELLEFTPVSCGRSLYLLRNDGTLIKMSRRTGAGVWKRKLGALAASSPACNNKQVVVSILQRGKKRKVGAIVSVDAEYGRTMWRRNLRERTESSPLLFKSRVYVGTEGGSVLSLRARDGAVRWRTPTEGAVKGGVAMSGGKLFVGDYSGRVYAMRRATGDVVWVRRPKAGGLHLRGGTFYSTPAIAFGRLYIGSTDGGVYSLSTSTGKTAWRTGTGDFVYGSPVVGAPGGRPTVYVGSYDGKVYALDARNGRARWIRKTGGKISGSGTLVGDTLWIASLGERATYALGAQTGRVLYRTGRGMFTAVVSDGRRIYLNGPTTLYALDGTGVRFERGRSPVPASNDPVLSKIPAWKRHRDRTRGEQAESTQGSASGTTPSTGSRSGDALPPLKDPGPLQLAP